MIVRIVLWRLDERTPSFEQLRDRLDELEPLPAPGAFLVNEAAERIGALIVGEEDPVTTPETVEAMLQGIPDTRLVSLPGAAHLVNVERPDDFTPCFRSLWKWYRSETGPSH